MDGHKIEDFELLFAVPLSIGIGKRNKQFILNQNNYRNAHFRTLSDAKKNWNDMIASMNLADGDCYPFDFPVRFHYFYYPKSKRSYDRMNILSIIDKFTCDALIECGILKDDNYKLVLTPTFKHCRVDRENPRCEIYIERAD